MNSNSRNQTMTLLKRKPEVYRRILNLLPASGAVAIWIISVSPILRSSWSGDDWPNSQTPYWLTWRYGRADFANTIQEALYWNRAWMFGQGRFYPFSWIESRIQFVYLRNLEEYKVFQFTTMVACGLLFIYLVYLLSRSQPLAIATLAFLAITIQFRRDFDPHLAFASMVPLMLMKVFLSCILAYRVSSTDKKLNRILTSIGSSLFFFMAMSTYEFAFVLFPIVLISFVSGFDHYNNWSSRLTLGRLIDRLFTKLFDKNFRLIFFAWISYGFLVFGILRNVAKDISGAYVLGISTSSIKVFITQITSGMPLISFNMSDFTPDVDRKSLSLLAFLFVSILILVSQDFRNLRTGKALERLNIFDLGRKSQYLLLFSIILVITPGMIMSFQQTWWDLAGFQKSYLGVMITEFGTALLFSLLILNALKSKANPQVKK
jgi:hypothetical protein